MKHVNHIKAVSVVMFFQFILCCAQNVTTESDVTCGQVTEAGGEIVYHSSGCHLSVFPDDIPENVTTIDVSLNEITNITIWTNFSNLLELTARENLMEAFPNLDAVAETLEFIDLSQNKIRLIEPAYLDVLTQLQHLDLSENELLLFPLITGPCCLQHLNLGYNSGLGFPPLTFIGGDLEVLLLSACGVLEVNETDIAPLNNLKVLSLGSNSITQFPNLTTVSDTLKSLTIGGNQIEDVPTGLLESMTKLQDLKLYSNRISLFPNLTAIGDTLETLYLGYNLLNDIPVSLLEPLNKLSKLLVQSNELTQFPDLRPVANGLKTVDVSDNPIDGANELLPYFLQSLPNLDYVSLNNLGLHIVNISELCGVIPLQGIELYSNSLVCDCHMRSLKMINLAGVPVLLDEKPCSGGPQHLVDIPWDSIQPSQFICPDRLQTFRIIPIEFTCTGTAVTEVHLVPKSKLACANACTTHSECLMFRYRKNDVCSLVLFGGDDVLDNVSDLYQVLMT